MLATLAGLAFAAFDVRLAGIIFDESSDTAEKKTGPTLGPVSGFACLKCNYELFHNFFFKEIFQLVIALTANTVNSFSVHRILQSGEGHGV